MKLRNRIFIGLSLGWLAFSALIYFTFKIIAARSHPTIKSFTIDIDYFFYICFFLGIVFFLFNLWLVNTFILKRLKKLTRLIHAKENRKDDELINIAMLFKNIKDSARVTDTKLEQRIQERTQELQSVNAQLQQEICEHEQAERDLLIHRERLVRLAHYDNLTSLPNRIFFNEIFNKALDHAKRHNQLLGILFINIDRFKTINNQFGRKVANLALKELSLRFKSMLRSDDIIARLGGDEFIILLIDIENPKFVSAVAEKLLQICKQIIKINGSEIVATASIGIAIFPGDGQSLEELQMHADMAMYRAKYAGGNVYQYYKHAMDIAAHEHMKLDAALRHAIEHNEFVLHYQPQLSLEKGTIKAVEALIRWQHPELGLLGPDKFIRFAEETDLIGEIGAWVLRQACLTNKAWQSEGYDPIIVTVNISAKQFHQEGLAELVAQTLKETGLNPAYLGIEITETSMMNNVDMTIESLKKIHDIGVQISIDDFGAGYTSINYLKQLPVDVLKIDQSFIKGIPHNQNDMAITGAVIELGHNLGLQIVAEGVETTEQIQYLAEQKCDLIQGYFLSRPLPENKIILQFARKGKSKDSIVEREENRN